MFCVYVIHRSGELRRLTFRDPLKLLRGDELRTKSGMGGVISLLGGEGVRDPACGLTVRPRRLCAGARGLGLVVLLRKLLFDRIRMYGRAGHAMTWSARGLAMMLVPGVASGGGIGLSVLKRGWICASLTARLGGLETSGIMRGATRCSSASSSSISGRKGPSRARAGVTDRLPGIGSKGVPFDGAICITASRTWLLTLLVSQLSKPSEWDTLSIE